MIKSQRRGTNKAASAANFRQTAHKTHPRNVVMAPRRGGWRL